MGDKYVLDRIIDPGVYEVDIPVYINNHVIEGCWAGDLSRVLCPSERSAQF